MFQSPAFRVYNTENADSQMARKGGLANSVTRKAFQDRPVNTKGVEKTPLKTKLGQQAELKPLLTKAAETPKQQPKYPDWMFECSYKEVEDNYEDILPKTERLSMRNLKNTMRAFTNLASSATPAPPQIPSPTIEFTSPEIDPLIFNIPTNNQKFVFNYLEMEEEAEIAVPMIDDFDPLGLN